MNKLQNKLESTLITRTFHISGMPEAVFKDMDDYCKEYYGDSRWTMVADLHRMAKEDYKFSLLYDELLTIKEDLAKINDKEDSATPEDKRVKFTTFGRQVGIDDLEKGE